MYMKDIGQLNMMGNLTLDIFITNFNIWHIFREI